MRFVSRSVVTGFVNALAILIFMAQLPELTNVTWQVYAMTAAGLGIIYLFPLVPVVGKLLPLPCCASSSLTAVAITLGIDIRTVGDMGELPDTLPVFLWPDVPLNLETLAIIFPYSAGLAVVGLLESMMTAAIVDEMTDTPSDRNRECKGRGSPTSAPVCWEAWRVRHDWPVRHQHQIRWPRPPLHLRGGDPAHPDGGLHG